MFRPQIRSLAVLAAALTLPACSDGPTALEQSRREMAALAGDYGAAGEFGALTFTTTDSGESIDWLEAGASIELRLTADGGTSGRLFVTGVDEDGGDMDEELTGTWTLDAGVVRLDHEADTFLRDMPFRVEGKRLVGEASFDGIALRVELARR